MEDNKDMITEEITEITVEDNQEIVEEEGAEPSAEENAAATEIEEPTAPEIGKAPEETVEEAPETAAAEGEESAAEEVTELSAEEQAAETEGEKSIAPDKSIVFLPENHDAAAAEKKPAEEKGLTRSFVAIALAAALLLNAAISAGIMGYYTNKQIKEIQNLGVNGNESHHRKDMGGKGGSKGAPSTGSQDSDPGSIPDNSLGGSPDNGLDSSPDNSLGGGQENNLGSGQDNSLGSGLFGGQEGGQNQSSEAASGASIGIIIKDDSGVYIVQVTGNNAKNAGLKEGDKIVSIEGKAISTSSDLIAEVQSHQPGDTVTVTVERDGSSAEIKTQLE